MDETLTNIQKAGYLGSDQVLGADDEKRAWRIRNGDVPAATSILRHDRRTQVIKTYVTVEDAVGNLVTREVAMQDLSRS